MFVLTTHEFPSSNNNTIFLIVYGTTYIRESVTQINYFI